jgi:hypothetical protein
MLDRMTDVAMFEPSQVARDAIAAEEYLGCKFDVHQCAEPKG